LGRHLVYCEGTVSEINFIDNIKDKIAQQNCCSSQDVTIVPVRKKKGKHTNDLIDFAIADTIQRIGKNERVDAVWLFYDKDSFPDFDKATKRIFSFDAQHYLSIPWYACWSNECFELWYYLYFNNLSSALHRSQYLPKINSFLKPAGGHPFAKNTPQPHDFLTSRGGSIDNAIHFASSMDKKPNYYKKPNPSTGIYRFAKYMKTYWK